MLKKLKTQTSKIVACILVMAMVLSAIPANTFMTVLAAAQSKYTVELPEGIEATVSFYDEANPSEAPIVVNTEDGKAVFDGLLDDAKMYTVEITDMADYKDEKILNHTLVGTIWTIAQSDFDEKDAQTIEFADANIQKKYDDATFVPALSNNGIGIGAISYSSSVESVATINETTGEVTICGVGTTELKVTKAADNTSKAGEDTVDLVVSQADNALLYTVTDVTWAYGDVKTNELTVKDGATGDVTYASNNTAVAEVNIETGEVTIVGVGEAEITATFIADATSGYTNSVVSYTIQSTKKANALVYESTVINKNYGDGKGTNNTLRPTNVNGIITFTSDNTAVAIVNETTGEYTIVGAGSAKITATLDNTDTNYESHSAYYTLNVAKNENALSFAQSSQTYTYGDAVVENTLTVAHKELNGFVGPVSYSSSDDTVAAVDPTTGALTIKKAGNATVTASIDEENNYEAAQTSYTVVVEKKTIEFKITEIINCGEEEPDLNSQIKEGVIEDLIDAEKNDENVINRVLGCIEYAYPDVPENELRQESDTPYVINFTCAVDDWYDFALTGTLMVVDNYTVAGTYIIEGLNSDKWGSVANKVKIKVSDTSKYRISKTKRFAVWEDTELVYDTAADMKGYSFYIREVKTGKVLKKITETFGIDGNNPELVKVTFKDKHASTLDKIIHTLTFGLFCNEAVEIKVDAVDETPSAGIKEIKLIKVPFDGGAPIPVSPDENTMDTFTVELGFEGTFKVVITDKVDNTTGEILVTGGENGNSNMANVNGYTMLEDNKPVFDGDEALSGTPVDGNGIYEDATDPEAKFNVYSGNAKVAFTIQDTESGLYSLEVTLNGDEYVVTGNKEYESDHENEYNGPYSYTLLTEGKNANSDGKYKFNVKVTDNAGNVEKESITLGKDWTSPIITDFDFGKDPENYVTIEDYGYYFQVSESTPISVKVSAEDVASTNEMASGVKSITIVLKDNEDHYYTIDASGEVVSINDVATEAVAHDTTNFYTFKITEDFKGQIFAFATDNVGNTPLKANTEFDFKPNDIADGVLKGYKYPTGSAIESEKKHSETSDIKIAPAPDEIAIGEQNEKYNFSKEYEDIYGGTAMLEREDDKSFDDTKNVPLYNDETSFTVNVVDSYSGIRNVKVYQIINKEKQPLDEVLIPNNLEKEDEFAKETGWEINSRDKNLVTDITKTIPVDGNFNNMVLLVELTDRAGNSSYDYYTFGIDKEAPIITVEMNDNDSDKYAGFFKTDRVATITIKERNFKNELVTFTATVTDDKGTKKDVIITPEFVAKKEENSDAIASYEKEGGDHKYYEYTMDYVFSEEGDYTFDIKAKDLATHDNAEVSYVNAENEDIKAISTVFTIDKTLPVITVSYDNNNAKNEKYFAKDRTATVVINEHNFKVEDVVFTQTATLNGTAITIPTASWKHEGNVHTATIPYTTDGDYTFDVSMTDQASNASKAANYGDAVAAKDFVLDKTIAKPVIGGVANGSAYKDKVVPTISFTDVNYDKYEIELLRTRKDEIGVNVTDEFIKAITENAQGGSGTYDMFDKIVENDGIYTLTVKMIDKAGNEETEKITFSVNRFGSVYEYDDYLTSLIKDGGQYITIQKGEKAAITEDLVITEYNADRLLEGSLKILITRDGETIEPDYTTTPDTIDNQVAIGESGWYQYVYAIKASNFAKDGVYKIALTSAYATSDSDNNESSSVPDNSISTDGEKIVDTMNFTVDTTAPEIRNIVNLEEAIVNAQTLKVKYTIVDVGGLKSIEVILNGETIDTITEFDGDVFNYTGTFTIDERSEKQTVQLRATDLAGNVTDTDSKDFSSNDLYVFNSTVTVSTNFFVRWYANTPLFWGSIAGVIVLAGGICFLIAYRNKKKEE